MSLLARLPTISRSMRSRDEGSVGNPTAQFHAQFAARVKQVTPDTIAAVAQEERAAAKSEKQRRRTKRPLVRSDNLSCRADPNVRHVLIALAKQHGKKSFADGLHIAVDLITKLKGIEPIRTDEEDGDD